MRPKNLIINVRIKGLILLFDYGQNSILLRKITKIHPLISCYRRHSEILTVSGQWTLNVTVSRQNRLIFSRQREQPILTLQANPPYFQHRGHLFCDVMITPGLPAGGRLVSYVKVISGREKVQFCVETWKCFR